MVLYYHWNGFQRHQMLLEVDVQTFHYPIKQQGIIIGYRSNISDSWHAKTFEWMNFWLRPPMFVQSDSFGTEQFFSPKRIIREGVTRMDSTTDKIRFKRVFSTEFAFFGMDFFVPKKQFCFLSMRLIDKIVR